MNEFDDVSDFAPEASQKSAFMLALEEAKKSLQELQEIGEQREKLNGEGDTARDVDDSRLVNDLATIHEQAEDEEVSQRRATILQSVRKLAGAKYKNNEGKQKKLIQRAERALDHERRRLSSMVRAIPRDVPIIKAISKK